SISSLLVDNVALAGKARTHTQKIGFTNKSAGVEYFTYDLTGAYAPLGPGMSPVTSIGEIVSDEQKITGFVSDNYLYLKNVPAKSDVSIYNALGVLVTRISDYENNAGIALEDRGLYLAVIKSGSKKQSLKIMH
ncbi:MAG: T9SS type A sorting domain-containing protein, partial [Bacteroidota bacterium]|nr:T9SS type A sorting domain-containing protein [Bacteroidota bacterium]